MSADTLGALLMGIGLVALVIATGPRRWRAW